MLRDRGEELHRRLILTPYSEVEFQHAALTHYDEVEQARRDYVRWRQSIGGRADHFSFTLHRPRRGMADVVSGYLSSIDDELPKIIGRLRTVQILCRPAVDVIQTYDAEDTLIYCDPPYLPETRAEGGRVRYAADMTEDDHWALAQQLLRCKGKVVLSGYPSLLYDTLFRWWNVVDFIMANHAAGGSVKKRQVERLWFNFDLSQAARDLLSQFLFNNECQDDHREDI